MPVTHRADRCGVARGRRHHAPGRTDHRLEDERRHALRAERRDARIELLRQCVRQLALGQVPEGTIGVGRGHERHIEQAPLERSPPLEEAREGKRSESVAMVGARAGDEVLLCGQAPGVEVL